MCSDESERERECVQARGQLGGISCVESEVFDNYCNIAAATVAAVVVCMCVCVR